MRAVGSVCADCCGRARAVVRHTSFGGADYQQQLTGIEDVVPDFDTSVTFFPLDLNIFFLRLLVRTNGTGVPIG